MSAKVKLPNGSVLVIDAMKWVSADAPITAERLNFDIQSGAVRSEFGSYEPDPDGAEARRVAELLKGEVIENNPPARPYDPEVAY